MPLTVSIYTPEKLVLERRADSVVVPAEHGELGIFPGHTPLVAHLQPGAIRIREQETTDLFAISGGFIEVKNDQISVFAETAEMADDIDIERARQAAERAKAALRAGAPGVDLQETEAALRRAMARLRASESLGRSSRRPKSR